MTPENKRSYFYNLWSVAGAIGSTIVFVVLLFFIALDFFHAAQNPYLHAITYLVVPAFLIVFLIMIPAGALLERKKRHRHGYVSRFPIFDFNNPRHQRVAFVTITISTLFLLFSVFGAYQAYEFTESTTFCGLMCHSVMEPEHTAYQHSPHARVACVKCHIGPGADWYVRSKMDGIRQVFATIKNSYSRPIQTPIHNLRPAPQTCEQCHWPQQFFGAIEQDHRYYLPDEKNTEWQTRMLIHVGGGTPPAGKGHGIHWHMNINNKIYYVASDKARQIIPWVKKVGPDGKESIYVDENSEFSATQPPEGEMRLMDCVDCHNRPSHIYRAPVKSINQALAGGQISKDLPFIKREAVNALIGEYASAEDAAQKIREKIESFYQKNYPDLFTGKRSDIENAVQAISEIYRISFFPKMKVNWKVYPDNIGHMNFDGCFRCHDGAHKNEEGQTITNNCNACHTIIQQGPTGDPAAIQSDVKGLEFVHPEDIGDAWKDDSCTQCHTGELV